MKVLNYLGKIGRALMLPIATLPAAALLLRLGAGDMLGKVMDPKFAAIVFQLGNVMFANLPLIFALGVAVGLAEDNHGAAALAGVIAYFCVADVSKYFATIFDSAFDPAKHALNSGVLGGIVAGITGGTIYNKYKDTQLPKALAFFSGRRLVPLMTLFFGAILALLFGGLWPYAEKGIAAFGNMIAKQPAPAAAGVFTTANRLLIPFGIHHILNSFFWFTLNGGDLTNFFATPQVAGSGIYMTGFFPTMMFALPAIAAAMTMAADKDKRKSTAYLLGGAALVGFLTGVTEPIEFAFMFVAPMLYLLYAVMSGIIAAITIALGSLVGFGFSAGLFDLVLNWNISTKPWMVIVIGLVSMPIYYFVFYYIIKKFNIQTPGRGEAVVSKKVSKTKTKKSKVDYSVEAKAFLKALGGKTNITSIDNCATRLRLKVKDASKIKENQIKAAGGVALVKMSKTSVQVIVGTHVQQVAEELKKLV